MPFLRKYTLPFLVGAAISLLLLSTAVGVVTIIKAAVNTLR